MLFVDVDVYRLFPHIYEMMILKLAFDMLWTIVKNIIILCYNYIHYSLHLNMFYG